MEWLQRVGLFTCAHQLDGLAGDLPNRQGSTSTRITVGLGQNDAGQRQGFVESLGGVGGVLTRHGIHDEQGLMRRNRLVNAAHLSHHVSVDMQPPGGIDDEHVDEFESRVRQGRLGDFCGILIGAAREKTCSDLLRQGLQLIDRRRAVDVATDQQRFLALTLLEMSRELGGRRGLARPLQTGKQDDNWGTVIELQLGRVFAQYTDQFLIDDLDQNLARGQAGRDFASHRPLANLIDEPLDDRKGNIGIEQGRAHLTQRLLDVFLGKARLAPQLHQGSVEAFGQIFEHVRSLLKN